MIMPTIQEITAAAWYKIGALLLGNRDYTLLVYQRQTSSFDSDSVVTQEAYWCIEYGGISFFQPYLNVKHPDAEEALKLFGEKLKDFRPASLKDVENHLTLRMI